MAKISPVSIKYMISANFKAEGPLEKPDVIGAIFGQTEGLLGEDLEMRELQKEGKIGRIEVNLQIVDGKSVGEIQIPSALDKSETTLIAAALETIDKIGPTEAKIEITKIEDVRANKRDFIIDRAKRLLESIENGNGGGMSKALKEESRVSKIQEYGGEKLPAGDISGNELIVVEGRADVVNLLKNRINNVIGMNGTKLPAEIAVLGGEKEITLFIDGDRGGRLIAKNVIAHAKVAYVAIAPDGKEVEELEGKEILMALRKRIPVGEFIKKEGRFDVGEEINASAPEAEPEFKGDVKAKLRNLYEQVRGDKSALILDGNLDVIRKVSAKEVVRALSVMNRPVFAVVVDGQASSSIIRVCDEKNIKHLAATTFFSVKDAKVNLISL